MKRSPSCHYSSPPQQLPLQIGDATLWLPEPKLWVLDLKSGVARVGTEKQEQGTDEPKSKESAFSRGGNIDQEILHRFLCSFAA